MDRLVYTALSGMRRADFAQSVTANNLANVATPGFRRDTGAFESRWLAGGAAFEARVQASEQVLATDVDPGAVSTTGRAMDVSLRGRAMLAVESAGGGESYTRRGDLRVGPSGILETGDGRAVIGGNGGPIAVPAAERIEIASDGTILIRAADAEAGAPMVALDRLKLVAFDVGAMAKREDGLFARRDGGETPADEAARLDSGALEGSNVTAAASLVDLIEQSRAFELATKMIGTARDLDQSSMALMRVD